MENFTIISEISEILIAVLKKAFTECGDFASLDTEITLGLPDGDNGNVLSAAQVFVHLYGVEKNAYYEHPDDRYYKLPLELHYLMIAAARDKSFEHKVLGKIMETFNANKVMERSANKDKPDSKDKGPEIIIDFYSMTIDDRHKIWTAYPKLTDKIFIRYVVRPVILSCDKPKRETIKPEFMFKIIPK
jgi:hypothetical protein